MNMRHLKFCLIAFAVLTLFSTSTFCEAFGIASQHSTNYPARTAAIWTDRADYPPESTVTIFGTGFNTAATITLTVTNPDSTIYRWTVLSNSTGGFTATYQLDSLTGSYTVTATDGTNTATATFTDATFGLASIGSTSYPTITVGNTAEGTTNDANSYLSVDKYTTTSPLTAVTIKTYGTVSGNVKVSIYSDASGLPGTLLFAQVASAVTANTLSTITISNIYLATGTYWIADNINVNSTVTHSTGVTGSTRLFKSWPYANAFPNPGGGGWTTATSGTEDSTYVVGVQIEGYAKATKATLSLSGGSRANVASMSFYSHSTGNFRLAIYSDSSGPSSKLWESGSAAATASAWNTVNINAGTPTSLTLNAVTYWLVWQWDSANNGPSYTAGSSNTGNYIAQAYGSFPSSWSGGTSTSETWSEYVTYNIQYFLTVNGGNGITYSTPSQTSDNWYDSGTSTTVSSNGVYGRGSGTGQRVASWNIDGGSNTNVATTGTVTTSSINMSAAHTVNFNSVTQYQLTFDSGATGAFVSCTSPTISGDNYWYDSGTTGVSATLNGVYGRSGGSGTRISSYKWDSGSSISESTTGTFTTSAVTMSATHQVNTVTVTQYQVTLDSGATSALNSITLPTITSDNYWYDSGTTVTIVLHGVYNRGSGTGTRLTNYYLNGGSANPVSTISTITVFNSAISNHEYVTTSTATQYQATLDSGATSALSSITNPTVSSDNYWYDSGTSVTITLNGIYGRSGGSGTRVAGYALNGGSNNPESTTGTFNVFSGTIGGHEYVTTTTVTQYYLTVSGGDSIAYGTAPTISGDTGWYDSGTSTTVSSNWVWDIVSGHSRYAITNYAIDGGNQNPTRQYSGTLITSSVTMSTHHTVAFDQTTQYYFSVSSTYDSPTGQGWYDTGTSITSTVTRPVTGGTGIQYETTGWTGTGSLSSGGSSGSSSTGSFAITAYSTCTWNWKTQYQVTFSQSGLDSSAGSNTVLTVGSTPYAWNALPSGLWVDSGTTFSWSSPVGGGSGKQFVLTGHSGLTSPISASGTDTGNYKTQWQVTFAVSPSGAGTTNPSGSNVWEDSGSLSIAATANSPGYVFTNWTSSTGSITFASSTSSSTTATISGTGTITANFAPNLVCPLQIGEENGRSLVYFTLQLGHNTVSPYGFAVASLQSGDKYEVDFTIGSEDFAEFFVASGPSAGKLALFYRPHGPGTWSTGDNFVPSGTIVSGTSFFDGDISATLTDSTASSNGLVKLEANEYYLQSLGATGSLVSSITPYAYYGSSTSGGHPGADGGTQLNGGTCSTTTFDLGGDVPEFPLGLVLLAVPVVLIFFYARKRSSVGICVSRRV